MAFTSKQRRNHSDMASPPPSQPAFSEDALASQAATKAHQQAAQDRINRGRPDNQIGSDPS